MSLTRHGSGGPWEEVVGYARVVAGPEQAWTAGCTATIDGQLVGEGDAYLQTITAFGVGLSALARAGFPAESVVHTRMYVVDIRANHTAVGEAHSTIFDAIRPAATMVGVAALIDPRMLVEIELVAYRPNGSQGSP